MEVKEKEWKGTEYLHTNTKQTKKQRQFAKHFPYHFINHCGGIGTNKALP